MIKQIDTSHLIIKTVSARKWLDEKEELKSISVCVEIDGFNNCIQIKGEAAKRIFAVIKHETIKQLES